MTETVWLAVIAGAIGLLSPMLLAVITNLSRRMEKKEDWARQDIVASRLLASNTIVASKLDKNNALAVMTHAIVNSNMTATLQTLLDSLKGQIVMMRELQAREKPTEASALAIKAMQERIKELSELLDERRRQEALSAQAKAQQVEETANDKH